METVNFKIRLYYGVGQLSDGVKQSAFSTFLFFYYNQVLGLSGSNSTFSMGGVSPTAGIL